MLFGPVLKEIQAPQGIPTLDREHSHGMGNIHIGWGFPKIWQGTTIHAMKTASFHLGFISDLPHFLINFQPVFNQFLNHE